MPAKKKTEETKEESKVKKTTKAKSTGKSKSTNNKPAVKRVKISGVNEENAKEPAYEDKIVNEHAIQDAPEVENDEIDLEDVYEVADALIDAPFYDVEYDREVFMELRKIMDNAYAKKNKSKEDEQFYDEKVYNLTTNCLDSEYLQDFIGYCYKKGKYDFCLMNFEKYMKWTILAGSRGNAFSLSKLQLFFANQIDELLSVPGIDLVMDNFELEYDQFVFLLLKKLCDQLVFVLDLFPEKMIKEPEVTVEQSEPLMRKFDRAKDVAFQKVKEECEELIKSIQDIDEEIEKSKEFQKEVAKLNNESYSNLNEETTQLSEDEMEAEAAKQMTTSNRFVKKTPSKKKFRW